MAAYNATAPPAAPALVRAGSKVRRKMVPASSSSPWRGCAASRAGRRRALVRGLQPDKAGNESAWRVLWALDEDRRDSLPRELPDEFRVRGRLPLLATIAQPEVKVVVSHCGAGAAMEALAFGKPLLCVPFFGDQRDVARRVADAAAGLYIEPRRLTEERVREAVSTVAGETYKRAAAAAAAQLRAPGGIAAAAAAVEACWAAHGALRARRGPAVAPRSWFSACVALAVVILVGAGASRVLKRASARAVASPFSPPAPPRGA